MKNRTVFATGKIWPKFPKKGVGWVGVIDDDIAMKTIIPGRSRSSYTLTLTLAKHR